MRLHGTLRLTVHHVLISFPCIVSSLCRRMHVCCHIYVYVGKNNVINFYDVPVNTLCDKTLNCEVNACDDLTFIVVLSPYSRQYAVISREDITSTSNIMNVNLSRRLSYGNCLSAANALMLSVSVDATPHPFGEVPGAYFGSHQDCHVTLYRDADATPSAWRALEKAIMQAEHFIYIAGWALDIGQRLQRQSWKAMSLGVLLLHKAQMGVRILILLWDAPGAVMHTRDEEVYKFFRKSAGVRVIMARRIGPKRQLRESYFSHHQKSVVCDAPNKDNTKSLVAFTGGLDITLGRYDKPDHPLFKTLFTLHRDDFMQTCIPGSTAYTGAPRLPWHDVHCRVRGLAAVDILNNFKERWTREVDRKARSTGIGGARKYRYLIDELASSEIPLTTWQMSRSADAPWTARVLRSIDSTSVKFFHDDQPLLETKRGIKVDNSLHAGYVHAIRAAKRFIYIEQQYFVSSSPDWHEDNDASCFNVIVSEIIEKIITKIRTGEQFHVYILIPLHPDGDPSSRAVQGILHLQKLTIASICRRVSACMRSKSHTKSKENVSSSQHLLRDSEAVTDYISFYCLGSREQQTSTEFVFTATPNSMESVIQRTRRFMIYVHSKLLIVDDEYVIIGSGNLNERSMAGDRDSEIAIAALQCNTDGSARRNGAVRRLRRALWKEHMPIDFAGHDMHPESAACVRIVQQLAKKNWELYNSQNFRAILQGHMMWYPYSYHDAGVGSMPGASTFPDRSTSTAYILGTRIHALQDFII